MYLKSVIQLRAVIHSVWMLLLCYRSFTFTVNNMPGGHILVMAVVLPVRLQLSSNELILRPQGFLVKTCFRGTVRMYNHQNYFVKFEWQSINTGKEMAFSIRPAKGNSLFCLFDLDIHLFVCSGLSHILSVYCIKVLRMYKYITYDLVTMRHSCPLGFPVSFPPPPSPSLFIANLGIVFI